ncbi:potassium transporter TrkG [Bacillus tianshenii]|nr:potassium transporter TrkG [Bacillus tianshenii]
MMEECIILLQHPFRSLILIYITSITLASVFLKLPFASVSPHSWSEVIFTAVSSVTLIGFTVIPIEQSFTLFGEIIILLLIQLGGYLLIFFSTLLLIEFGRNQHVEKIFYYPLSQEGLTKELFVQLSKKIISFMLLVESIGVFVLTFKWANRYGFFEGLYYAIFHTVSAFNNAGISLWSNGLSHYRGDPMINLSITLLFVTGGLGYLVWMDILKKRRFFTLTLHSKIMLIGTIVLNVGGTFALFMIEKNKAFVNMDTGEALWASYFQTLTTRSAGFTTISVSELSLFSLFLMMLLMLIGAGSGSTGSGLKLTSVAVILFSIYSYLRKRKIPVLDRKELVKDGILKAMVLTISSLLFILMLMFFFLIRFDISFFNAAFEAFSLTSMAGISLGVISNVALPIEQLMISLFMLLARLGPLYIGYTWLYKRDDTKYEDTASVFVG